MCDSDNRLTWLASSRQLHTYWLYFLDKELIPYRYLSCSCSSSSCCSSCSCWGDGLQKRPNDPSFKMGSGRKLAGLFMKINGVGFSSWCHTFKMAAITSFHTEKCCHLKSTHAASVRRPLHAPAAYSSVRRLSASNSVDSSWSIVHSYLLDQELILYRYHHVVDGETLFDALQKSLRLRFKSDLDEVWRDCSVRRYTSTDGVRFSIWCHSVSVDAITSACCFLFTGCQLLQFSRPSTFVIIVMWVGFDLHRELLAN